MSTMQALAASILESATALSQELSAVGIDDYSLDSEQAPVDLPLLSPRGSNAQSSLIAAAEQILRLARGPLGYLNNYGLTVVEAGTLRALVKLAIPTRIPLGESRSYQELADDVNISPELLQRLIRYAAVCGFLREDDDGRVRHNSASAIFVRDHEASGGVSWNLEVPLKAAPQIFEALQRDPLGQGPRACAASLAYQSGAALPTLWEIHDKFPILRDQFHDLMISSCSSPLESIEHLVGGVDWTVLNTVIDVGGSRGHASQAITARYPHIRCIVQDTKEGIAQGVEAENVAFMEHDFFKPQTVLADAYLYRYIIHDWADGDARRILSGVVPVLRQGTKLIVMDIVAPAPKTVDLHIERCIRGWDVSMGVLLAGKERTLEQFQALVADVEARLRFQTCVRPSGSLMSIMTWVYEG